MMPWLKPDRVGSIIIAKRKPSGAIVPEAEKMADGGEVRDPMLHGAAEDLIRAIHAKDAAGVASAIQACMSCAEPDGDEGSADGGMLDAANSGEI